MKDASNTIVKTRRLPPENCASCKFSRANHYLSCLECHHCTPHIFIPSNTYHKQQFDGVWPTIERAEWCGEYRRKTWTASSED